MTKLIAEEIRKTMTKIRNVTQHCDNDDWMIFFNRINDNLELQCRILEATKAPEKIGKVIEKTFRRDK